MNKNIFADLLESYNIPVDSPEFGWVIIAGVKYKITSIDYLGIVDHGNDPIECKISFDYKNIE